MASEF